jgi:catechol 2,3-dioxygenase-like lactoylglutathione lyase family enzyme
MIDHISTYAMDYPKSRTFYDAAMEALGYPIQMEMVTTWDEEFPERRTCAWGPDRPVFWLIETLFEPTPRHIALAAADRAGVDAFHTAVLGVSAPDHGAPGLRPIYHENYYGAFALDPDGNNVEAVYQLPV